MILPKTLKANEYRGVRIYIRRLGGETFEYLIPFKSKGQLQIFQNQVEIQRKSGQRMRKHTQDELLHCIALMNRTAELFLDDLLFQEEIYNQLGNRIKRVCEKVEISIRNQINKLK